MRFALVTMVVLAVALPARAEDRRVTVRVVQVSGGRAWLEPGEQAGVRRDTRVRIRGKTYRVLAATSRHAVVDARGELREGDSGEATVTPRPPPAAARPTPPPASTFRDAWPRADLPASAQRPRPVPLGSGGGGRNRATLSLGVTATGGDGHEAMARITADARVHAEPLVSRPLAFDLDAGAQLFVGPGFDALPGDGARAPLRVRELTVGYGREGGGAAVAGRLRRAAIGLGLVDGLRLSAPAVAGIALSAFGGFVPDALDGKPATSASRFGADAVWRHPGGAGFASLAAQGSIFDGEVDEKRLAGSAGLIRGPLALAGHGELAIVDDRLELAAASVDAGVRGRGYRVGARASLRRPDRSRWLASFLPASWLTDELRLYAALDASVDVGRAVTLGAGGHLVKGEDEELGGGAKDDVRVAAGRFHLELGVRADRSPMLDEGAARVAGGVTLGTLDVTASYRPAILRYLAAIDDLVEHRGGLDVAWTVRRGLELALGVEGAKGPDVTGGLVQLLLVWRPLR